MRDKRTAIIQRWQTLILDTYPADSRDFFRKQKNQFQNPVGATLNRQVEAIFAAIMADGLDNDAAKLLQEFIKIRAVQDFSPSEAIGFILYLKQAIREILAEEISSEGLFNDLLALETRIDRYLLTAFDFYVQAREKIFEVRVNALNRRSYLALRRFTDETTELE
ncbi:MAG: RsbRD N-terminal domain-containing protein [bacterium]|nr:RsbRD N-terminal domain-containing protein [bacterium]